MKFTNKKEIGYRFLMSLIAMLITNVVIGQYTIIGQNTFGGTNFFGPMTSSTTIDTFYSQHAYIYPSTTLGNLQHGDTIRSVEFYKSGSNSYAGSPRFRIFVKMSVNADFGAANLHWKNEVQKTGTVLAFEGDPAPIAGNSAGFKRFDFNKNYFVFDTSKGKHLEILVDFIQYKREPNPVGWTYESDFSVPDFVSNNETKFVSSNGLPKDSTNGSNLRKPYIKINYPKYTSNIEIGNIYCLGRVPILMNRADSIMVRVTNTGLNTIYKHPLYLQVTGANNFQDTIYIDSIESFESKILVFSKHQPDTQGTELVKVIVGKDDYALDNIDSVSRAVSYNVYSHANPYIGNSGGIGFSGGTGDFVAKFYVDSSSFINQVKVDFTQPGRLFQVGIWEENSNGLPGKNLFTSDTLTTVSGSYILPVLPRIKVTDGYFVGIRQTENTNVGFAFQYETPIRPNAFYFASPLGDTSWVPFDPGYDFRFNIQPRIQVANDVAILKINNPQNNDTLEYRQDDSIKLSVTAVNYGFNNHKAPFDVVCRITNVSNQLIYRDTATLTINGNDSVLIVFNKPFSLNNYGEMKMEVYTLLNNDKVKDNDTLTTTFYVVVRYDLSVENYFDPVQDQKFQLNTDKVGPVLRVVNFGASSQNNFNVTSRIRQGNKIARTQTKTVSLKGGESLIVPFDSFTIPWWGDVYFEAFVWNSIDSFASNDTARVKVYVDKSHDIGIVNVVRPIDKGRYNRLSQFQPYVNLRNYGVNDQASIPVYAEITNSNGKIIYSDSGNLSLNKFSTGQVLLKQFTVPDTTQTLKFRVISQLAKDQDKTNDTTITVFNVVSTRDLAVINILEPVHQKLYQTPTNFKPMALIQNLGNTIITTPPVFYCEIRDASNQLVYLDSSIIEPNLGIERIDTLKFNKDIVLSLKGNYKTSIWHKWSVDQEFVNNTYNVNFDVGYSKSVKAYAVDLPANNAFISFNDPSIKPKISIKNDGLVSIKKATTFNFTISGTSGIIYQKTGSVDSLAIGEIKTIELTDELKFNLAGDFTCVLIIQNDEDEYVFDDTLNSTFRVIKSYDVTAKSFVLPEIDSTIYVNRTYAPKALFENIGDSALNTPFSVSFLIFDGLSVIYNSNETITLEKGESKVVSFDSSFMAPDAGNYSSMAIVRLSQDQNKTNDTLIGKFKASFFASNFIFTEDLISIFPNPAHTVVYIHAPNAEINDIIMYDALGKRVSIKFIEEIDGYKIDITNLSPNIYTLEVISEKQKIFKKVMVH